MTRHDTTRRFSGWLRILLLTCPVIIFFLATAVDQVHSTSAANDAAFVSQNVPLALNPGATASVTITMRNRGTATWDPSADYFLGSANPLNNFTWGIARVPLPHAVSANQTVQFTFDITAPETPGYYDFRWQMVQEFVEWFGGPTANLRIIVAEPVNSAQFVSQPDPPVLYARQKVNVSVTMHNTGGSNWTSTADYYLGSLFPENSTTWGLNRAGVGAVVEPNQQRTFTFEITAPSSPGTYDFAWRMLRENVEWFGAPSPLVQISVINPGQGGFNGARFVAHSLPLIMSPGTTATVSITMENNGQTTWDPATHFLGSASPLNNMIWGLNRVALGQPVGHGQLKEFTFTITAPTTPGTYKFRWQMVHEFVEWFGETTTGLQIFVYAPSNVAAFVTQSVPTQLFPGEHAEVSITMNNI